MVYHGKTIVTTAGTAVQLLHGVGFPVNWITIQPRSSAANNAGQNTGPVRIGGGDPSTVPPTYPPASIPPGVGFSMSPGDSGVTWPMPAMGGYDLSNIWVDADNSGDGVQWIAGRP